MNKILSTTLISVALALTSVAASAEEGGAMSKSAPAAAAPAAKPAMSNKYEALFKKLDANHDGVIDKKEAKKHKYLSRSFKKLAKNGKLDKDGFVKWEVKRHHHRKAKAKAKASTDKKS